MSMLDKIRAFLEEFPQWDGTLTLDSAGAVPGSTGLYPEGLEELSRQQDIAGNVTVHWRLHLTLRRMTAAPGADTAGWVLALQQWIARRSAQGTAPVLGDDPTRERICAGQGKLTARPQPGTATYTLTLTADFVTHQ